MESLKDKEDRQRGLPDTVFLCHWESLRGTLGDGGGRRVIKNRSTTTPTKTH